MGDINLTEIRERAEAATGGAWVYTSDEVVSIYTDDNTVIICEADVEENLRFIAYAQADIPRLCDEIETLRRKIDYWTTAAGDARAKLAQARQRAVSRGGRVPK